MSDTAQGFVFKERNVSHIKRPAVTLIRKPLATIDELAAEVDTLVQQHVETVVQEGKPSNGKVIAVYWAHNSTDYEISKNSLFSMYDKADNRVIFKGPADEDEFMKPLTCPLYQQLTPAKSKKYSAPFAKGGLVRTNIHDRLITSPQALNLKTRRQNNVLLLSESYVPGTNNLTEDDLLHLETSYEVWVFDKNYFIPTELGINKGQLSDNILAKPPEVIYDVDKGDTLSKIREALRSREFGTSDRGKYLLKGNRNNIYRVYTVTMRPGVARPFFASSGKINGALAQSDVTVEAAQNYQKEREEVERFANNAEYKLTKTSGLKSLVWEGGSSSDKTKVNVAQLFEGSVIPKDLRPTDGLYPCSIYVPAAEITNRFGGGRGDGAGAANASQALRAGEQYYIKYIVEDGVVKFECDRKVIWQDVIDAYKHFSKIYLENQYGKEEDLNAAIKAAGIYEVPVVRKAKKDTQKEKTNNQTTQERISGAAYSATSSLLSSFSEFLQKAGLTTTSYATPTEDTSFSKKTYKIEKHISVIDFKLEHYLNVRQKYVIPRLERLREFADATNDAQLGSKEAGIINVFPNTFLADTNFTLEEAKKLPILTSNLSKENEAAILQKIRPSSKMALMQYFEDAYFGGWSGIYIASTTTDNEQISKFTNTKIYPNVMPKDSADLLYTLIGGDASFVDNISNKDVTNISVSRQTMGKSTAAITLNSIKGKYYINSGLNKGETLFEPMDEVFIYFPNEDGTIELSFRGIVSEVQKLVVSGYNSIYLGCECPIKRLEMTRTNVNPSVANGKETSQTAIHPWIVPESFFKTIDKWVPFILMQSLSYLPCMVNGGQAGSDLERPIVYIDGKSKPIFADPLLTYLWYKRSPGTADQSVAAEALAQLCDLYIDTSIISGGQPLTEAKEEVGAVSITKHYNDGGTKNLADRKCLYYNIFKQRSDMWNQYSGKQSRGSRQLISQMFGTMQPSVVLSAAGVPVIFSDYKTNMDILKETAEKLNFFIYSNRNGVVQYRPPQTDLGLLTLQDSGSINIDRVINNNDLSYCRDLGVLNNQFTVTFQESTNDEAIINWLPLSGEAANAAGSAEFVKAVVQDAASAKRYGIRSDRETIITGVKDFNALYIYGLALMDRKNKKFRTAQATGLAFGYQDINTSVYAPINNTVYLLEGLTQEYKAGDTFTYTAALTWGRKPIIQLTAAERSLYEYGEYKNFIDSLLRKVSILWEEGKLTDAYTNQLIAILDNVKANPKAISLLNTFIYNGYVWDGISSISFEDLQANYLGTELGKNTGFEIAIGTSSTKNKNLDMASLPDEGYQARKRLASLKTSNIISTIFTGNLQTQREVWMGGGTKK